MKTLFHFQGKEFTIEKLSYGNGRIAMETYNENGDPAYMLTVNIPDFPLLPEHEDKVTFIKNWSENEGILQALIEQKIVRDTGFIFPTGHVYANLVEVLI